MLLLAAALDADGEQRNLLLAAAHRPPGHPAEITVTPGGPGDAAAARAMAPGGGVPAQLPLDVRGFAGRARELAQLDEYLTAAVAGTAAVSVYVVSGTAGAGKTALAVHWAHQAAGSFPDGQLYVNLRGFDASGSAMPLAAAVRGFLDALGVSSEQRPASAEAQAALYRSLLAGRRVLIVLDNARDADQVRPLLPGAPGCFVIITSRNQLTSLVAAEGARPLTLDLMSPADAWELLGQRLGQERLAAEPHAVDEIMNRSARLPLALAVVAARAATYPGFPLSVLAGELRQARRVLDAFTGEVLATDVRAVFSWSYNMLGADAARLFRLLGLHPGPDTTVPAAASLAALSAGQVLPLLAELARANLLIQHAPGRYGFHDLLRAYAIELGRAQDAQSERDMALDRVFDHYLHTAHRAELVLYPFRHRISLGEPQPGVTPEDTGDHAQAMAWFTAEHQVLLAAIRCAASCRFDTHAWQIAWALGTFLDRQGHWQDACDTQNIALDAARRLADGLAKGHVHRGLARVYVRLGRYDDAHDHLLQAIDRFTETGDRIGQAYAQLNVGIVREYQGQFQQALEVCLRALALFTAAGHQPGRATALNSVGWIHAMLGDHNQALVYSAQGLAQYEEIGNRAGIANAADTVGYSHYHLGHHHQAVSLYQRAIGLSREVGDRYCEAMSLRHLGDALRAAGDHDSARRAWRESLAILDQLGHPDAGQVRMQLAASANGSNRS